MLTIMAVFVIRFTLPAFNAGPDSCSGQIPLDDLATVELLFAPTGEEPRIAATGHTCYEREGQPDSLVADFGPGSFDLSVVTWDKSNNRSCLGPIIHAVSTTAVIGRATPPEPTQVVYDIAGRRVWPPLVPGVYFTKGHKVVIIR